MKMSALFDCNQNNINSNDNMIKTIDLKWNQIILIDCSWKIICYLLIWILITIVESICWSNTIEKLQTKKNAAKANNLHPKIVCIALSSANGKWQLCRRLTINIWFQSNGRRMTASETNRTENRIPKKKTR